jgi:hypothetical protein
LRSARHVNAFTQRARQPQVTVKTSHLRRRTAQALALFAEATRLVMVQLLLQGRGVALNPITTMWERAAGRLREEG